MTHIDFRIRVFFQQQSVDVSVFPWEIFVVFLLSKTSWIIAFIRFYPCSSVKSVVSPAQFPQHPMCPVFMAGVFLSLVLSCDGILGGRGSRRAAKTKGSQHLFDGSAGASPTQACQISSAVATASLPSLL